MGSLYESLLTMREEERLLLRYGEKRARKEGRTTQLVWYQGLEEIVLKTAERNHSTIN